MKNKNLIIVGAVVIVAILAYGIYAMVSGKSAGSAQTPTAEQLLQNGTTTVPVLSPEKQAIVTAVVNKLSAVMASGDVKKIRAFTTSVYSTQSDKDIVAKITDAQLLQSAKVFKDFDVASKLATSFAMLPDSAWNITDTTATITQQTPDGAHKTVFTVNKVGGVWQ